MPNVLGGYDFAGSVLDLSRHASRPRHRRVGGAAASLSMLDIHLMTI